MRWTFVIYGCAGETRIYCTNANESALVQAALDAADADYTVTAVTLKVA